MREAKTAKIFLDEAGSFLGRGEGCLIVRDRKGKVEKYPLFEDEIGEVQIRIGNSVSSAALATCAFWGIDVLISTQRGNPVAIVKSLEDDSHVDRSIREWCIFFETLLFFLIGFSSATGTAIFIFVI